MKKMLCIALIALFALMNIACAEGVWLPDPCTVIGVNGEYVKSGTGDSGTTYDYYTYDFETDYETVASIVVTYAEALKDLGFTHKSGKSGNAVMYCTYTKGDYTAEMGVFVSSNAAEIANGGDGGWRIVLAVPQGMSFTPGSGAPGIKDGHTRCIECNGTGRCTYCGGTGRANYGNGYEECIICDGYGICNICDGVGSY